MDRIIAAIQQLFGLVNKSSQEIHELRDTIETMRTREDNIVAALKEENQRLQEFASQAGTILTNLCKDVQTLNAMLNRVAYSVQDPKLIEDLTAMVRCRQENFPANNGLEKATTKTIMAGK